VAGATSAGMGGAEVGQTVYRVWGRGDNPDESGSRPWSKYWSRIDPRTVDDYRDAAGLPDENAGRFLSVGILRGTGGVSVTEGGATSLGSNNGGIDELYIPYPTLQVTLTDVIGLDPEM
jgi:hypothetical protein